MRVRYAKSEIIERYVWTNNFRLSLGGASLVALIFLNLFGIPLSETVLILMMIGLFIFFYSALVAYFLYTQRAALAEVLVLSNFLQAVDLLMITILVYFSGGYDSPFTVGYFLVVALVPFWSPYYSPAPLVWAGAASLLFVMMVLLTMNGLLPYVGLHGTLGPLGQDAFRDSRINCLMVPVVLFTLALGEFFMLKYLRRERAEQDKALDHGRENEKRYAAFSQVFWILTHVQNPSRMLEQALDKTLEILGLRSGLVLLVDGEKGSTVAAERNIPDELINSVKGKEISEVNTLFTSLSGIFLGKDYLQKEFIRKLAYHRKTIGFLVLFSRGERDKVNPEICELLDAVSDELAAALFYSRILKRLKLS